MALRKAARLPGIDGASGLPESSWYSVKRRLLGPPLVNEQLRVERLSKPLGLDDAPPMSSGLITFDVRHLHPGPLHERC